MDNFFQKLKEQREQDNNNFRVLSGTFVPNSTFKSIHSDSTRKKQDNISQISITGYQDKNSDINKVWYNINI